MDNLLTNKADTNHNHHSEYVRKNEDQVKAFYNASSRTNLVFSRTSSTHIDHIAFDDSGIGAYHFIADVGYGSTGNADLYAGDIFSGGNQVATRTWVTSQVYLTSVIE